MKMSRVVYSLIIVVFYLQGSVSFDDAVKQSLIKFLEKLSPSNGLDPGFGWNQSTDPCGGQWRGISCNNQSTAVKRIVLDNLNLIGNIDAASLCSVPSVNVLSLNNNSITGEIPQEIVNCKQLTHFYARDNRLLGNLPESISGLNNLKRLVISNNNFSGKLPDLPRITGLLTFLAEFNQFSGEIPQFDFSNLQQFNVSFNNFSGPIPDFGGHFTISSVAGNAGLCGDPSPKSCPPSPPPETKSNSVSKGKALMYSGYVLIGLILLAFVVYRVIKRNQTKEKTINNSVNGTSSKPKKRTSTDNKSNDSRSEYSLTSPESGSVSTTSLVVLTSPVVSGLKFEDLLRAPAELVGRGKHGSLYKVTLENGTILAVKRVKDWDICSENFKKRMVKIDKVKHPNVLPAIAFYCSKEEKLLVYEFQLNGSLFKLLHGSQNGQPFDWNSRLNVAASVADALAFMHVDLLKDRISHGNLKSTNILFDRNMEPCVSEYGLMMIDNTESLSLTPQTNDKSTEKTNVSPSHTFKVDVYGFGVILLELLTGKLVQSNGSELARWVHSVVQEEWTVEVFDKALIREGTSEERMVNLLQVALKCINPCLEDRPSMKEVADCINTIKEEDERSIGSDP